MKKSKNNKMENKTKIQLFKYERKNFIYKKIHKNYLKIREKFIRIRCILLCIK